MPCSYISPISTRDVSRPLTRSELVSVLCRMPIPSSAGLKVQWSSADVGAMTVSLTLTLLIVWLLAMPVVYGAALAVSPLYLRRRASKRLQRPAPVSELAAFRARRSNAAGVARRPAPR